MGPTLGRVAIIGAGPTGFGAAWRLKELGHEDFVVYEASPFHGGLAGSHVDAQGFTWDIGGHVQHSHYEYFDRVMDRALGADGWLTHQRESWIWMRGRFIPYPFQYNIRHLPDAERDRCVAGLEAAAASRAGRPAHFAAWVQMSFGRGIADAFLVPYNLKVWAYPLEELAFDWIGDRVAVVDLARVRKNIRLGRDDVSWGPNNTFRFPNHGGTGEIWRQVARRIGHDKIRLRCTVRGIDPAAKILALDGGHERYDTLLTTAPLDETARAVRGFPERLVSLAARLKYSSSHVIGIGLDGKPKPELATKCWMYFPEDDCPFYRVTVFSNYSPNNVPDISRHWSLLAEVSESPKKPVDEGHIVEDTIRGLLNTGLIASREQIRSIWSYKARHGYPTPSVDRDAILSEINPALERRGVSSRGRFGAWKYEVSNQDHSFMQGVEWVDRLASGTPELTYNEPTKVNAPKAR